MTLSTHPSRSLKVRVAALRCTGSASACLRPTSAAAAGCRALRYQGPPTLSSADQAVHQPLSCKLAPCPSYWPGLCPPSLLLSPGPFHVFNCADEAACLRKWFDHMREVRRPRLPVADGNAACQSMHSALHCLACLPRLASP